MYSWWEKKSSRPSSAFSLVGSKKFPNVIGQSSHLQCGELRNSNSKLERSFASTDLGEETVFASKDAKATHHE